MADDHEFQELQIRVSELERLVKHQGEQLAIHAKNVEKHGARVAQMASDEQLQKLLDENVGKPAKSADLSGDVVAQQAAGQSSGKLGAFS